MHPHTPCEKPTLSRKEAQKMSGLGISSFDEALKVGIFPSIKVGRRVLIPRKRFFAVLEGQGENA
jgi:hypothetical protein